MRWFAVLALALAALGACTAGAAGTTAPTSLTVTYWEDGIGTGRITWTLRCNPARGTLPRPGRACLRLAEGGARLFAPLPKDVVCTEIYGGPQVARVIGVVQGKSIWATFQRRNGCEIGRWNGLSPWLLPPGGVT
jgi:hypothetical protein